MSKVNKALRILRLSAPAALALALAAPIFSASAADGMKNETYWYADGGRDFPKGQLWVNSAGECWQSEDGPTNLPPCARPAPPKKFDVRLNFEFDKYRLQNIVNDNELYRLDNYISEIKQTPVEERITVVGHTDAKGSESYNYTLGLKRAETVRDYMISKGIPAQDIAPAESRGKLDMLPGVDPYSVEQRRATITLATPGEGA
ncbi:MAG: OmpA family protein [Chromatiaceae bacterium]|jgi:OOP family OmpA-OmpF porin